MNENILMPKKLTAENGAKHILSGEFSVSESVDCGYCDDGNSAIDTAADHEECELCEGQGSHHIDIPIPWTTIKEIYQMAVENLEIK